MFSATEEKNTYLPMGTEIRRVFNNFMIRGYNKKTVIDPPPTCFSCSERPMETGVTPGEAEDDAMMSV